MKQAVCLFLALCLLLAGCHAAGVGTEAANTVNIPITTAVPTMVATKPETIYVEVMREGETERIPVQMVDGTVGSYRIATDPAYFVFQAHETVDIFSYEAWDSQTAVYYSISAYWGNPADFEAQTLAQFCHLYESYSSEPTTIGGYPAYALYFSGDKTDPMYCRHVYLVDCGQDKYLIEAQFTMEMYEGLYAIMRALFDTFYIV